MTFYAALPRKGGFKIILCDTIRKKNFTMMTCATVTAAMALCRAMNGEAA